MILKKGLTDVVTFSAFLLSIFRVKDQANEQIKNSEFYELIQ